MEDDGKDVEHDNIEPEHKPEPEHHNYDDGPLRELVNNLQTKVEELTETVGNLVTTGETDTTPVKKPWTHWGGK